MELIYSVKDLFANYLKVDEKFVIPAYQRGYKWKIKDIEQLLNDISAFQTHGDDEVFYCLQNITLVKNGKNFNVVDGQQRLTTLSLIMAYLGKMGGGNNKLEYNIRKETEKFLNDYVYSQKLNEFCNNKLNNDGKLSEWNDLGVTDDFNYQDIFYLYNAYLTIHRWFETNKEDEKDLEDKILNRVKLIVNLPQINSTQEFELFDNLNGKRVSLDGADLIRAMIITRVARKEVEDLYDFSKHVVMLNESRVKNGLTLDDINNWWRIPERQNYFGVFVRNINSKGENIIFDERKYPIDILYKLFIQTSKAETCLNIEKEEFPKEGSGTIKLKFFENSENLVDVFSQILDIQRLIEYWYEDAELYHLVRYAAIYLKKTFYELTNLWMNNNRNTFINELKKEINKNEFISLALQTKDENDKILTEDQLNFNENWYDGDNTDMMPIMVLLDIIRILSSKSSKFPIANLDPSHFVAVKEDKEHIFPQTPLDSNYSIDTLNYYIDVAYDCGYNALDKTRVDKTIKKYKEQILKHDSFREWFNKKLTTDIVPINSLGNVCLLQDSVNRSYGNDFFAKKHFDIMQKSSNGEYIRPHVLDAFAKIMATPEQREDYTYMQKWTKDDIFARRKDIVKQINEFLNN